MRSRTLCARSSPRAPLSSSGESYSVLLLPVHTDPPRYSISGSDRIERTRPNEPSWRVEDTAKLSGILADHGVDLIDVSSAGVHREQELPLKDTPAFQSDLSAVVKAEVGHKILVSTVGGISSGKIAQDVLDNNKADVVFVGRWLQKNPGLVWQFAEELGVHITQAHQIEWGFLGRGVGRLRAKN